MGQKKQFCKIQRLQGGRNTICITGVFSHHSILCNVLYSRLNLGWQCLTFLELRPVFNLQPVSVSGWKNFAKPKTENLDDKQYMLQAYVVVFLRSIIIFIQGVPIQSTIFKSIQSNQSKNIVKIKVNSIAQVLFAPTAASSFDLKTLYILSSASLGV